MTQYTTTTNIAIDQCPCCTRQSETQQHMILCDHNPNRIAALTELSTGGSKYKENHNLVQVLTDCIEQWIYDPTSNPSMDSVSTPTLGHYSKLLPTHMMEGLYEAIQEQNEIGWMNLFRGYFSTKWRQLASTHTTNPDAAQQNEDGRRRMGTVLQRVQSYIRTMWTGRNDVLHKSDKYDATKFSSLEAAEIRHYFHQPHLLSVQDRHYCQGQVLHILSGRPAYRRRWLMRVRKARAAYLKDKVRQAQITTYFIPRQNSTTTDNAPHRDINTTLAPTMAPQTRTHANHVNTKRTTSTSLQNPNMNRNKRQSMMHHFFPGRPPDYHDQRTSHKSHATT